MYISPSYVLHHIFHVTCRCFLGPRFGRAMSCCVASPQELQAKFHQWGGIRLHPSHDHFDPFSIETEAHWTGVCGKKTGKPHILPSIH